MLKFINILKFKYFEIEPLWAICLFNASINLDRVIETGITFEECKEIEFSLKQKSIYFKSNDFKNCFIKSL